MIRYIVLSFVAIIIASLVAYTVFLTWPGHTSLDIKSCMTGMVGLSMVELFRKVFKLNRLRE